MHNFVVNTWLGFISEQTELSVEFEWWCQRVLVKWLPDVISAGHNSGLLCDIGYPWETGLNSLAPGQFEWNFRHVIFKQILMIDDWGISCEIALTWMPLDFTDDQSTLVQVMAWCRQATSHYLSQCWPRSQLPNGVTRPQWVKMSFWQKSYITQHSSTQHDDILMWQHFLLVLLALCEGNPLSWCFLYQSQQAVK